MGHGIEQEIIHLAHSPVDSLHLGPTMQRQLALGE